MMPQAPSDAASADCAADIHATALATAEHVDAKLSPFFGQSRTAYAAASFSALSFSFGAFIAFLFFARFRRLRASANPLDL